MCAVKVKYFININYLIEELYVSNKDHLLVRKEAVICKAS